MEKPLPVPTATTEPFWAGLRERKILLQYSPSADRWVFYPRVLAPGSLAADLEWREASGVARLYTYTVARVPPNPGWDADPPLIAAIVELAEGPRLATELVGVTAEDVAIGMALRPVFVAAADQGLTLLKFAPASRLSGESDRPSGQPPHMME